MTFGKTLALAVAILSVNAANAADFSNPQPDGEDVVVSMPCNQTMVFRKVYTTLNNQNKSADASFQAGSLDNKSPLAQKPNRLYVQGGFLDDQGFYYLISKYELMDFQYKALMNQDKCPTTVERKGALPAVNISYFDLNEAARRYSLYLQKAADAPKNGKEHAYARLPTDAEWEFAARGGLNVSKSEFNENLPPLGDDDLGAYAWYQGPTSANGKLQLPGLKKPNPLGIYDILGNVFEMCQEPFKAVRTNRLLGQSGGMTVRGGSFKSPQSSLSNATRAERPYFINGKENRSGDLGGRLVLALSVAHDTKSVKALNAQIEALGTESNEADSTKAEDKAKTLAMIDSLKAQISELETQSKNDKLKSNGDSELNKKLVSQLNALRAQISDINAQMNEERRQAATSNLRLGGFLCRSIAAQNIDIGIRKSLLNIATRRCQTDPKGCELKAKHEDTLKTEEKVLTGLVTYYGDTMSQAAETYNLSMLKDLLTTAKKSQGQNNAGLDDFIDVYYDAIKTYPTLNKDRDANHKLWVDKCFSLVKDKK